MPERGAQPASERRRVNQSSLQSQQRKRSGIRLSRYTIFDESPLSQSCNHCGRQDQAIQRPRIRLLV